MGKMICGIVEILFGAFILIGLFWTLAAEGDLAKRVVGLFVVGGFILGTGVCHLISGVRSLRTVRNENQAEQSQS